MVQKCLIFVKRYLLFTLKSSFEKVIDDEDDDDDEYTHVLKVQEK